MQLVVLALRLALSIFGASIVPGERFGDQQFRTLGTPNDTAGLVKRTCDSWWIRRANHLPRINTDLFDDLRATIRRKIIDRAGWGYLVRPIDHGGDVLIRRRIAVQGEERRNLRW